MHKKGIITVSFVGVLALLGLVLNGSGAFATQTCTTDSQTGQVSCTNSTTASVTVSSACSFNTTRATGYDSENGYTAILANNASTEITGSTFTTICNDPGGYAIYAVGYGNNTLGETDLISANGSSNITTSSSPASGTSYWQMKLTATTLNQPSIDNDYSNYSAIPSTYTKVASYSSITDPASSGTRTGQPVTTYYKAYASSTQPADTYTGAVKYTMVHPETYPAPLVMIDDLKYMQDFATLTSAEKTSVLNSMTTGTQYQLKDNRDQKDYYISKLADGNVWMTQNLDLDLESTPSQVAALTSANTDLPSNTSWTPARSTYPTGTTTWGVDENTQPESYDPGDICWDGIPGSGTTGSCSQSDIHYHLGNYYNWTAAVAMNDSSAYGSGQTGTDVGQSICPAGWRLPLAGDDLDHPENKSFAYLTSVYGWTETMSSPYIWGSPLYFSMGGAWFGEFEDEGYYGDYLSSVVFNNSEAYNLYFHYYDSDSIDPNNHSDRYLGNSVRCVAR